MAEKKKILFIDDEVNFSAMITKLLTIEGYEVVNAYNGQEGLDKLRSFIPHLILLDIYMPKMGGIEFYKKICTAESRPNFPVIVLTALGHLAELFRELNVDGFITKPCKIADLLREIELVVKKRYSTEEERVSAGSKKRVLIVEDNPAVIEKISKRLFEEGFTVSSVRLGGDALECILNEVPDFMLIKLLLPDMSGDSVVSKLKHMPRTMDMRIILYTPLHVDLDHVVTRRVCERLGITNFLETDEPDDILFEIKSIEEEAVRNIEQSDKFSYHYFDYPLKDVFNAVFAVLPDYGYGVKKADMQSLLIEGDSASVPDGIFHITRNEAIARFEEVKPNKIKVIISLLKLTQPIAKNKIESISQVIHDHGKVQKIYASIQEKIIENIKFNKHLR